MSDDSKELVIKISGDVGDYKAALELAKEQTEQFEDAAADLGKYAGVAFAALSAQVYVSVRAFGDQQSSLERVNQALQNQGLYTDDLAESYRDMAEAISKKTGLDVNDVSASQAQIQSFIGQRQVTEQLMKATVDFASAKKISLQEASLLVGKAISGETQALQRQGITIKDAATESERMSEVTDVLTQKFGGSAEAQANAAGNTDKLTDSFKKLEASLGKEVAPAFDKLKNTLTDIFNFITEHPALSELIGDAIIGATVVAGLATSLGLASYAFVQFRAACIAAGLAEEATTLITRGLVNATGIGALVTVALLVYQNWSTIFPRLQQIYKAFTDSIVDSAAALSKIFSGIFHLDAAKVKEGVDDYLGLFKKEWDTATAKLDLSSPTDSKSANTQNAAKAAAAKKAQDLVDAKDALEVQKNKAKNGLILAQEEQASADVIALYKKEIEIITQMEDPKNLASTSATNALKQQLENTRKLLEIAAQEDKEQRTSLHDDVLKDNEAFNKMDEDQQYAFLLKDRDALQKGIVTKQNALETAAKKEADIRIKANNQEIADTIKYGANIAAINKVLGDQKVAAADDLGGQLADMANSNNSVLKDIGKAAAISDITIATAKSAAQVWADSVVLFGPIAGNVIGPGLAAARIAYGAEQIGKVTAAEKGGLAVGGQPGKDSIPFMLQDHELVAPPQNFEEVIGSVAASRAAKQYGGSLDGGGVHDTLKEISSKLDNGGGGSPTVVVQGNVMSTPEAIQMLGRQLSDALQFGNLKIYGINSGKRFNAT